MCKICITNKRISNSTKIPQISRLIDRANPSYHPRHGRYKGSFSNIGGSSILSRNSCCDRSREKGGKCCGRRKSGGTKLLQNDIMIKIWLEFIAIPHSKNLKFNTSERMFHQRCRRHPSPMSSFLCYKMTVDIRRHL